jgi:RimJ/RimL family protein N-acetyltransferase
VNLVDWESVARPERAVLEGNYARLEPLDPAHHAQHLLASAQAIGGAERFRFLFDNPPADEASMDLWLGGASRSSDPLFFAVIDSATGRAEGRQALMRITPEHGVIEIGNILWGTAIARTRVATEAFYVMASYVFDSLGYRRLEWKCDNENEPSKRAALRFGFTFEGLFRQHMIVKGRNRDTAWFAMLDADWPRFKRGFEDWLKPENFDNSGAQRTSLKF